MERPLSFLIYILAGAPDYIHTDARTNFHSSVFKERAAAPATIVLNAPIKTHDDMSVIEQVHICLWTVSEKFCMEPSIYIEGRSIVSHFTSLEWHAQVL